jgi:flagellar biogenesis protein FliO
MAGLSTLAIVLLAIWAFRRPQPEAATVSRSQGAILVLAGAVGIVAFVVSVVYIVMMMMKK